MSGVLHYTLDMLQDILAFVCAWLMYEMILKSLPPNAESITFFLFQLISMYHLCLSMSRTYACAWCDTCSLSWPLHIYNPITGFDCSTFHMIKYTATHLRAGGVRVSSRVVSRDRITLRPALLPSGLGVILKSVIYELALYILHTERTVMFTSLQLFVDGRSTPDGCTGVPFSPAFTLYKYSIWIGGAAMSPL